MVAMVRMVDERHNSTSLVDIAAADNRQGCGAQFFNYFANGFRGSLSGVLAAYQANTAATAPCCVTSACCT
jgi:hypothetical protein